MVGNRIKALREELNLKQDELAKKIGVSPSAIGMYERNSREANDDIKLKMCNLFNCSMDYLTGKSNYRNDEEYVNAMIKRNDEFIKKQYKKYGAKKESNVFPMADEAVPIPVVGKISAGLPILATENIERYEFAPSSMIKEGFTYFYLTVIRR